MSIVKGYSTVVYTSGSVDSSYMWHWFQIPFHLVPFHWANEVSCVCRDWTGSKVCPEYSPLILEKLGTDSWKKVAVLLDFVQITSTPPLPLIGQLVPLSWTPMCQKIWARVSPSLPIPKLTQYIQFVKSGQKIWAGFPPLIWTRSKRTAIFLGHRPLLAQNV